MASHRVVSQRTLERVRRIELVLGVPPSHYVARPDGSRPLRVAEVAAAADADADEVDGPEVVAGHAPVEV